MVFEEVHEAYTTQICSCCGSNPSNSPKGRTGLGIREWTCNVCGSVHDRDVNAARNILALEHERLAVGIPVLGQGGCQQTSLEFATGRFFCEPAARWESPESMDQ
ncbi:transposase [Rhodoferax antarcticus]|uniref:transposase n=1 Tax=Rhodoferax antarcticus TaxID=81479 RepID=UPI0030B858CA